MVYSYNVQFSIYMEYQENINHIEGIENDCDYKIHKLQIQAYMGEYSFSMILPKSYALEMGLRKGDYLKVYKKVDALVIKKA